MEEQEPSVLPKYVVTGTVVSGKRFRRYTNNFLYAFSINLYRGSIWEIKDGHRKLLKRVWN